MNGTTNITTREALGISVSYAFLTLKIIEFLDNI